MKITEKGTKKYTKEEKLSILQESEAHGPKLTMEKYGLYPNTFYYWKRKYKDAGAEGLAHGMTKERLAMIKKLEKENQLLKELLAEEKLAGKLKDELLKKKYPHLRNVL